MANMTHGDLKQLLVKHFKDEDGVGYTVCQDGEAPVGIYFYGKVRPENWNDFVKELTTAFSLRSLAYEDPTVRGNGEIFTCFGRFWW